MLVEMADGAEVHIRPGSRYVLCYPNFESKDFFGLLGHVVLMRNEVAKLDESCPLNNGVFGVVPSHF